MAEAAAGLPLSALTLTPAFAVVTPAIETAPLFCMVTPVPTVSLVVTKAVSSTSNTSIWAVPSMNKS